MTGEIIGELIMGLLVLLVLAYLASIFLNTAGSFYKVVALSIGDLNRKVRGLFLIFVLFFLNPLDRKY